MQEIKNNILKLVQKITDNKDIKEDSLLLDEGWIDSLTAVVLLDELEKEFSIEIDTEELTHDNFNSIESISKIILDKIEK